MSHPLPEAPLPHKALDMELKAYFRVHKSLPFRLLGLDLPPDQILNDDTSVVVRELEPDRFFLYRPPGGPHQGLLLESFMDPPKEAQFSDCLLKALILQRDRQVPVVLVFLYLRQGQYATFPDTLEVTGFGGLKNRYQVEVRRLWEYEPEIRNGSLRALAPLLLLWETDPETTGREVLRETLRILETAPLTAEERRESLALTFIVGRRVFSSAVLRAMLGEGQMHEIRESGIIGEWMDEARAEALLAGEQKGRTEGRTEGRLGKAHEWLLRQGERRFRKPTRRIRTALRKIEDEARLDDLALRLLEVETWDELLALG